MDEPWGWHLLLDCTAGLQVHSKENIINFVKELVVTIDMIPFGEPWIERFATHDENKAGYSFCQMITTSNITGHFVEKNGNFFIDVFSCKEFNPALVSLVVKKYFNPLTIKQKLVLRG